MSRQTLCEKNSHPVIFRDIFKVDKKKKTVGELSIRERGETVSFQHHGQRHIIYNKSIRYSKKPCQLWFHHIFTVINVFIYVCATN